MHNYDGSKEEGLVKEKVESTDNHQFVEMTSTLRKKFYLSQHTDKHEVLYVNMDIAVTFK